MSVIEAAPAAMTPEAWRKLIRPHMNRRRQGALNLCEAALAEFPQAAELHVLRGEILILLGRGGRKVAQSLSRALELAGPDPKIAIKVARAYSRQGRIIDAIALVESALAYGETSARIRARAMEILVDVGDFHEAALELAADAGADPELQTILDRALAGLADDAGQGLTPEGKGLYRRGMEHLRREEPSQAAPVFARLTRACPAYAPGWLGRRGALEAQGSAEDAAGLPKRWIQAAATPAAVIGAVMNRRLSPRGLAFDPRERFPVRPKEALFETVGSAAELTSGEDVLLQLDPGGQAVDLDPVISLDGQGRDLVEIRHRAAEQFIASIGDAAVVGRGVVLTRDGALVDELNIHSAYKLNAERDGDEIRFEPATFRDGLCPMRVFGQPALLLTGPTDSSFGDWMVNFPPRLAMAEAAGLDCPVLLRADASPAVLQMLAALGVPESRILFHDPTGVSLFPKLYAPSWPLPRRDRPMADLFGVYRRAARCGGARARERLYLSREHISKRRLANELQVQALFEAKGFRVIHPERLEFEEMLQLFARPACVAGAYGSAFLNLAFSVEKPVGLALMPPESEGFLKELAFWLGSAGVRFGYLRGEGTADTWTVRLPEVEAAIDEVLRQAD